MSLVFIMPSLWFCMYHVAIQQRFFWKFVYVLHPHHRFFLSFDEVIECICVGEFVLFYFILFFCYLSSWSRMKNIFSRDEFSSILREKSQKSVERGPHLISVSQTRFPLNNCYATMCPVGLQGAVRSRQVHQLKQGSHVGCGLSMLFKITDITNSKAEQHFRATTWIIGELLKVNTANWLAFLLKYEVFDKFNTSTTKKDSELPCLG